MKNRDILKDLRHLALASRLKRLSDNMLADAAIIHSESDVPLQPGQFPLIAALDRYGSMTINDAAEILGISQPAATRAVSEAVKAGIVVSGAGEQDKRVRQLSLTEVGEQSVARMKSSMWPRVEESAISLTRGLPSDFLESLNEIELRLEQQSMLERFRDNGLSVIAFNEEIGHHFYSINKEWIESMFVMESTDRDVLMNPQKKILHGGGEIYFVQNSEQEILGTCALKLDTNGFVELTKMGVYASARHRGAGEFLLRFVLKRCRDLGWHKKLYLMSNKQCTTAISLYERMGFVHDASLIDEFGARYERCDVAMRYTGEI